MIGFMPGFAYLGPLDERLRLGRRESPRLRVPAGAVAIAGEQTAIYPLDDTGRLVGHRTNIPAYVRRVAPAGVAPRRRPRRAIRGRMILVVKPGLLTTVQDAGRWGWQHEGIPVAGPMDPWSHARANRLVGNAPAAATLEITLAGPRLRADGTLDCGDLRRTLRCEDWRARGLDRTRARDSSRR